VIGGLGAYARNLCARLGAASPGAAERECAAQLVSLLQE